MNDIDGRCCNLIAVITGMSKYAQNPARKTDIFWSCHQFRNHQISLSNPVLRKKKFGSNIGLHHVSRTGYSVVALVLSSRKKYVRYIWQQIPRPTLPMFIVPEYYTGKRQEVVMCHILIHLSLISVYTTESYWYSFNRFQVDLAQGSRGFWKTPSQTIHIRTSQTTSRQTTCRSRTLDGNI